MKKALLLVSILIGYVSSAQKITILDEASVFPIYNVVIYNAEKTKQAVSDKNGIADLSIFEANEALTFTHIAYRTYNILKGTAVRNRIVYLANKTEQLEEVFLSASKGRESTKRIAEQVAIISKKEIVKLSPQTSADLLGEVPGIKVQKSQFGGGSPVLRGMEANRVLLVVDGVRMNNAIYRKGHLQNSITVSPSQLERTEVIFGPSSVIYGSDALGGVIHYYTKKPRTNYKTTVNSSVLSRFSTANNEKTVHAGVELQLKKFASYTSISHSNFGDLRMGTVRNHGFDDWGLVTEYSNNSGSYFSEIPVVNTNMKVQRNTGYDQTDFLQKIFIPITDKTELTLNFQYGTSSEIPRFDRLTERRNGELRFAEWYYGPQKRLLISSQLEINPGFSWLDRGTVTMAYQDIEESRVNRRFGSFDRINRNESVQVFSINGDFNVPLTSENDRILSYGIELTHNEVSSLPLGETLQVTDNRIIGITETFPVQARYADGGSSYTSAAAYINYRQDISDKSTLNTGIRFTDTYLNAKWIDNTLISLPDSDIYLANSAFTATVGYVYKPTNRLQINGVLSSGFRSPNIDDVGKVREKAGNVTVPNIELRPEYAYNAELGLLGYFNNKRSYLGLTAYYTLLNNYIIREPFMLNGSPTIVFDGEQANIFANVNRGNAYIVGGTINTRISMGNHVSAEGSITYTKGKAFDTDEPLSSIPPVFGRFAMSYSKEKFETGVLVRFNGRKLAKRYNITEGIDNIEQTPLINLNANNLADQYYGTPAWMAIGVNTKYSISKAIDVRMHLDNIFDIHYREFASGVSAPGRNLSLSLIVNF